MRSVLIRSLLHILSWMPLPLNHAVGYILGLTLYLVPNKVRRISRINLALCLPEHTPERRDKLLRASLIEMGKSVTELGPLWLWKPEKLLQRIRHVVGEDCMQQAMDHQKGIILLTPHLGCWELNSLFFANRHPITCLYRPPKLKNLEVFLNKARQRSGARLVPTNTTGVKTLYATLAQHDTVGILPDQDPGRGGGIQAPFFSMHANTIKLIPRLINKTGARVVMVYAHRLPWGKGYDIHYQTPEDDIYSADLLTACTAMNRAVESCIRDNIEQYQWAYKRFKTQADGKPSPYDIHSRQ